MLYSAYMHEIERRSSMQLDRFVYLYNCHASDIVLIKYFYKSFNIGGRKPPYNNNMSVKSTFLLMFEKKIYFCDFIPIFVKLLAFIIIIWCNNNQPPFLSSESSFALRLRGSVSK